jgi:hypothetical protein
LKPVRILAPATKKVVPLCVGLLAAACSVSSARPAALGDCVPTADASCSPPISGGGGSTPGDGGGTTPEDGGGGIVDAGSCGTAGALLSAANGQCEVCIASSCCLAAASCTGQCLSLVTCPTGTIASCETTYPQGIAAYNDLGSCIAQSCATQCPVLPVATAGDI